MTDAFLPVDLAGLRVAITAGASGIGATIAEAFGARGASVCVSDISAAAVAAFRADHPDFRTSVIDVADPAAVAAWFDDIRGRLSGLDVLVNNAGIAGPTARVEDVTAAALDETLAVNVAGQFHCARHAVPMLNAAGGGSIINLGSIAGRLGFPMRSPYAASKWAVVGFTKSLAMELGEQGIRVNAILPGHVDTERFRRVVQAKADAIGATFEDTKAQYLAPVSLKRNVRRIDIANIALYLASPFGINITGQAISVCGDVQMMR